MLPATLDSITVEDINALVGNRVAEGLRLDYKEQTVGPKDSDCLEFLDDVTSFANSSGGDILFGVKEDKGVATGVVGIDVKDVDAEVLRLTSMIRTGVSPRLDVKVRALGVVENQFVLVVRVPRAWRGLHMVSRQGKQHFIGRNNSGKFRLDVLQIQAGFLGSAELLERARAFRESRVNAFREGKAPVSLWMLAGIAIHCIPASAFEPGSSIDVHQAHAALRNLNPRFNIDGVFVEHTLGFMTVYRSGVFESVSSDIFSPNQKAGQLGEPNAYLGCTRAAKFIFDEVSTYLRVARTIGLDAPAIVFITAFGMGSVEFAVPTEYGGTSFYARRFDRSEIYLPDVLIEDVEQPIAPTIRPVLDALWQAANESRCTLYRADGTLEV